MSNNKNVDSFEEYYFKSWMPKWAAIKMVYYFTSFQTWSRWQWWKEWVPTCIKSAFAPCCANIHSESVFSSWVKVANQHLWISGVDDSAVSTCSLPRGFISYKVHRKPSCLMEGEWGPNDKGSSVVADPPKLHIVHSGSGSCNKHTKMWLIREIATQKQPRNVVDLQLT